MSDKVYISEIFDSFQGEGEYIGFRQVFVRFSDCFVGCPYCDTDYSRKDSFKIDEIEYKNPVNAEELTALLIKHYSDVHFHSFSLTGGEPLMNADFIAEFCRLLKNRFNNKIFLETSGLASIDANLFDGLVDIISADIKTHSDEALSHLFVLLGELNKFKITKWYLKLLISEDNIKNILEPVSLELQKFNINKIILQPVDNNISLPTASYITETLYGKGIEARLIAQTHKLISIR